MDKWQEIWNRDERVNKIILEMLIKADGFDSGAGSFGVDDWIEYTHFFYDKLNLNKYKTIFDIGCGSGAFVYPLYLQGKEMGGVDYSHILINVANMIMTDSDFIAQQANSINTTKKYDCVVSHSVFHYFKDLKYVKQVIVKMLEKSNHKIAIDSVK